MLSVRISAKLYLLCIILTILMCLWGVGSCGIAWAVIKHNPKSLVSWMLGLEELYNRAELQKLTDSENKPVCGHIRHTGNKKKIKERLTELFLGNIYRVFTDCLWCHVFKCTLLVHFCRLLLFCDTLCISLAFWETVAVWQNIIKHWS